MGLFGSMQKVSAEKSPCHQAMAQEKNTQKSCNMCIIALEAWEENAISNSKNIVIKVPEFTFVIDSILENFVSTVNPLEGFYYTYYPPPEVILKAVTPNTKTIVLRV